MRAIAAALSGSNSSSGRTDGRPKKTMNTVTRIGSPRNTSMYRRIGAWSGRNRMVISVPSRTPIRTAPVTAMADTRSVPGRPSRRM
jgi:hypothetical protein